MTQPIIPVDGSARSRATHRKQPRVFTCGTGSVEREAHRQLSPARQGCDRPAMQRRQSIESGPHAVIGRT
jgi:hypothetical protein